MKSSILLKSYILVFIGFTLTPNVTGQVRAPQNSSDPKAILVKMAQKYGTLSSYEDIGVVVSTTERENSGDIEKIPFKTFFTRPGLFRFEWIDYIPWKEGRLYMIWSTGKATFSYWQPDRYEEEESLERAIAGATGISYSAAYTIPTMLMNYTIGFRFIDLRNLTLTTEEIFEGELCYHIKGHHPSGDLYDLWISKKDYLLRKSREESKQESQTWIKEEIHRKIRINQPIAKSTFEFQPPIPLSRKEAQPGETVYSFAESPNWTEFVSKEGRFSILLPAKPITQTLTFETGQGRVVHYGFTAGAIGTLCTLDYADLPKTVGRGKEEAIFDEVRDAFLKEAEGKLANEKTIALEGHPGREITIHIRGGEMKARLYLVNERLYQLVITQFIGVGKSSEVFDKFFNSFKIIGESGPTIAARGTSWAHDVDTQLCSS